MGSVSARVVAGVTLAAYIVLVLPFLTGLISPTVTAVLAVVIGVAGWMAVLVMGVAVIAGVRFPRWFWGLFGLGILFSFVFIAWLIGQSFFDLHTLCPWCGVTYLAVIPTFLATIAELGQIFTQLAQMVAEQRETVQRIDADTVDIASNVSGAQRELLKYYASISSNRWLMLKVFGVLIVFVSEPAVQRATFTNRRMQFLIFILVS